MRQKQLDLLTPEPGPVTFVQACHLCGARIDILTLDDPGEPWQGAVLWGYVELQNHLTEMHPKPLVTPPAETLHPTNPQEATSGA